MRCRVNSKGFQTMMTRNVTLTLVTLALAGCATTGSAPNQLLCTAAGALAAGGAAYVIADDDNEDEGAAIGAAIGALVGYAACSPKAEPPPPAPEPKPAPPPKPEPEKDSDGDGVVDSRDDCPDTPRGTPVDARGCPEIPDLEGVHFDFDKATLTPAATQILDGAATTLERNPHVRIEIVGHTDSVGSDSYNQGLSERRAESVRSYLLDKGVAPGRITAEGRGESAPVTDNDTSEGRARNRRVELTARPR